MQGQREVVHSGCESKTCESSRPVRNRTIQRYEKARGLHDEQHISARVMCCVLQARIGDLFQPQLTLPNTAGTSIDQQNCSVHIVRKLTSTQNGSKRASCWDTANLRRNGLGKRQIIVSTESHMLSNRVYQTRLRNRPSLRSS
jgi:hypothetical protein